MRIEEKEGRLAIVDFDEIEAYKIACKIEKDGIEFYTKLIATLAAKPKETLRFLLEQEKKHLEYFENCIATLRRQHEDVSEDNDLLESMEYGIFPAQGDSREGAKNMRSPREALTAALAMEERSIKFYQACDDEVSSADTKERLLAIINEEKKHAQLFNALLKESGV